MTFLSFNVQAAWQLKNDQSTVNFVSIKKSSVGEVHHFKSLSGLIDNGNAKIEIEIDLLGVETNIPIRNERMQSMLFEVSKFTSASITTKIDNSKFDNLKSGEQYEENVDLTVNLHGVTRKIKVAIQVVKLANNSLLVYSEYPVILKASDFGLANGIQALREIAKLPSISTVVPVTFSLIFSK